jgi:hypothetical protein
MAGLYCHAAKITARAGWQRSHLLWGLSDSFRHGKTGSTSAALAFRVIESDWSIDLIDPESGVP